ncbi:MAG: ISAzo13 family transposase [Elusimicrobia bacterium]|nr:ISAzo13 family transposase [Elusimicrobiota bacterium]
MKNEATIREIKSKFSALDALMDERVRRQWVGAEAESRGWGGVSAVSRATGISRATIVRGMGELRQQKVLDTKARTRQLGNGRKRQGESNPASAHRPHGRLPYRIRRPGGGRKSIKEKDPAIVPALERLLKDEVAGDPMTKQKWVRSSLRKLSVRLADEDHHASPPVVARLLKDMGFSLKANTKRKHGRHGCPERDKQFKYIASQKQHFIAAGLPVISIDAKKKELIGAFLNKGRTWRRDAEEVNEHDFPGAAVCRATPFGIYDIGRNKGHVYVGVSNSTPEFAVHSIARWWKDEGSQVYPKIKKLLILADGGGSNGCRVQAWKLNLQEKLCDEFGLRATVCHYPTGCSKWNPIEHRLFSFISRNWEGRPLKTLEIMLGFIRGTSTTTGLEVKASLDAGVYKKGQKARNSDMDRLKIEPHAICPKWNYTLSPRKARSPCWKIGNQT